MGKIMHTYAQKYRFKHPTTSDFQKVVEQVSQTSWQSYFDQYVYGSQMADVAIDVIKTKNKGTADNPRYESTVQITSKDGDITDVPIVFAFEDGKTMERTWSGKDGKVAYTLGTALRSPGPWLIRSTPSSWRINT